MEIHVYYGQCMQTGKTLQYLIFTIRVITQLTFKRLPVTLRTTTLITLDLCVLYGAQKKKSNLCLIHE